MPSLKILPWLLIAIVTVAVASLYGGYQWGHGAAVDQQIAQAARDDSLTETVTNAVADAIGDMQVTNTTVNQRLEKEIVEKPVYRDAACVHDADVMRIINAAITGQLPADSGELPGAGASGGSLFRGYDPEADGGFPAVPEVPSGGDGQLFEAALR